MVNSTQHLFNEVKELATTMNLSQTQTDVFVEIIKNVSIFLYLGFLHFLEILIDCIVRLFVLIYYSWGNFSKCGMKVLRHLEVVSHISLPCLSLSSTVTPSKASILSFQSVNKFLLKDSLVKTPESLFTLLLQVDTLTLMGLMRLSLIYIIFYIMKYCSGRNNVFEVEWLGIIVRQKV